MHRFIWLSCIARFVNHRTRWLLILLQIYETPNVWISHHWAQARLWETGAQWGNFCHEGELENEQSKQNREKNIGGPGGKKRGQTTRPWESAWGHWEPPEKELTGWRTGAIKNSNNLAILEKYALNGQVFLFIAKLKFQEITGRLCFSLD